MFRCVAAIPNTGGNCVEHFYPDTEEGRASAESFSQQYNRDGWGVYDCVSPLKGERRAKDNVAQILGLHWDLDARHLKEGKQEILERVRAKLEPFGILSRVTDSGRGIHLYSIFNEPIEAGTIEEEGAHRLLRRMATHLGADMAPTHFAALMRRAGTINSKEGGGPCQLIVDTRARCEPSDVEAYLDLVEVNGSLFTPHEETADAKREGPVDVEAELAAMKFEDDKGAGVNATYCRVIPSLIWKAWHPDDIVNLLVDAAMQMAERCDLKWDRTTEVDSATKCTLNMYHTLFEKEYDHTTGVIPVWLPMEFQNQWAAILAGGRRPTVARNGSGWYVRKKPDGERATTKEERWESQSGAAAPFVLRPFVAFDPAKLKPREYYDIPLKELEGWFFMTSGNEVPLRVAQGYSNLQIDHRLVKCITEVIGDNKIDVATFDPLVTLHGVPENDTGKMDTVIRIFAGIADTQNCAIELSHHTRKLMAGSTADYTVDDMRGAGSLKDAMRAVRMLNYMPKTEAESAGIPELERTSYFRVDRVKANNAPPAKAAIWRKFINVDLPNSDEVGVIVPWAFPGQDAPPTAERTEANHKAEHIFLELLARFTLADRSVNDSSAAGSAPSVFAKEREAKLAKVGKAALADAMRRLFEAGKIKNETYGPASRDRRRIVIA
jgi:hypothetical protein